MKSTSDRLLSFVPLFLLAAGSAVLTAAVMRDRNALMVIDAGVQGTMSAGLVGIGLAMLGGLSYRHALLASLPIAFVQFLGCRWVHASYLPVLGVNLVGMGAFGLIARAITEWLAPKRPVETVVEEPASERRVRRIPATAG